VVSNIKVAYYFMSIAISIVSHGHGKMAWSLVEQVLRFPDVTKLVLTVNIPESIPNFQDPRVELVFNRVPKGFGENHNVAFRRVNATYFCVLNPDIVFIENIFPKLLSRMNDASVGVVAPIVINSLGLTEDSMRLFLTPGSMMKRWTGVNSGAYSFRLGDSDFMPDWVAGMFMLFSSNAFAKIGGFDKRYFMYCEDADICIRLWKAGYKVVGCLSASVLHNAQRVSRRSFRHLSWHLRSMVRYFFKHSFSFPNKDAVI